MARHPSAPNGACLLAVLTLAVAAPAAFSRAYYVAPSGSDDNGGLSWADAKRTIQAGINLAASAHETVLVAKGTFYERVVVPAQVTLEGGYAGPGTANPDLRDPVANPTVIHASDGGSVVTLTDGDILRGFTIQHGSGTAGADGKYGGGIYAANVASVVVRDCRIQDCTANYGGGVYMLNSPATDAVMGVPNILSGITFSNDLGVYEGGAVFSKTGSILISHSVFADGKGYYGGAICLKDPGMNTVIHDNLLRAHSAFLGGGIYMDGGQARIYNNTIQGSTDYLSNNPGACGGIYILDGAMVTVENNVITGNHGGLRAPKVDGVVQNNDVWGNTGWDFDVGTILSSNLQVDPRLADPAGGDFTLQRSSPCKNAGTDEFYIPYYPDLNTDLAGRPRRMGAHVDMGAYEVPEPTNVGIIVPGNTNPWLAGMPNGSTAKGDTAPDASPTPVPAVLTPGTAIQFAATGSVSYDGGAHSGPPDGDPGEFYTDGADDGISGVTAVVNCLLGVFLDNTRPDATAAPAALSFGDAASLDFTTLKPALKQVFFIGDGKTSGGVQQSVIVPAGATRLFLGTLDGVQWSNNTGQFNVTVKLLGPAAPFTRVDIASALRMAGGLLGANAGDIGAYDVVSESASAQRIDLLDVIRLARKVTGPEANP